MVLITLGLAFLLFFAPVFGWALAIYLAHKTYISKKLNNTEKKLTYIALVAASILPFHNILAYPLIVQECNSYGGEESFENDQAIPKDIAIDGYIYNLHERYPVSELLLNETVNSIYYAPNSRFGEGADIKSAAENYGSSPFILKSANTTDVACGPFYHYARNEEIEYHSDKSKEKCIAYEQGEPTDSHLKVRKTVSNERSIRTLWHNIEWTKITYEIVSKNSIKKIHEIRDFDYKGLAYPVFVNWFSFASYSCTADTDAYITLKKILHLDTQSQPVRKISMQASKDHLSLLQKAYFGFEIPKDAQKYDIQIYDSEYFSSPEQPLKINIYTPKLEVPILLILGTNRFAEWNVKPLENNQIFVELKSQSRENKLWGVESTHIIETKVESNINNHLLKFYSGRLSSINFDPIYCSISGKVNNIETKIDLSVCTNENRAIKLNE